MTIIKTFGTSMHPVLHSGDVVYATKIKPSQLKVDDIVIIKKKL